MCQQWTILCIYLAGNQLYMVGYIHTDRRTDAVNLKDIASIKLAFKHKDPKADIVKQWIARIEPQEYVLSECRGIIYEGLVL